MPDTPEERPNENRPLIEWIFGAASAILVTALIAFLAHEAMFAGNIPPNLVAQIVEVEPLDTGTSVKFALSNRGDEAASAVTLVLSVPGTEVEAMQKSIEFDYVPGHAIRQGAFIVPGDVAAKDIAIDISGYAEP
ncbi:hypothetical protein [Aquamicrobium zhengzhouense]|uniref:TIGR02588 family protein n=1 Tax=Aquamicrobium zhengzhouense TaxID=2781738 RepID=A0ABS0SCM8_9HYPH|nr:hypothetical protein [Aquamicrobium zhengzhouense]MBI1621021.1 hypothetical protein [Aquamicrobium zhengzhouense]